MDLGSGATSHDASWLMRDSGRQTIQGVLAGPGNLANGGSSLVNLDRGGVSLTTDMACVRPEDEKPDPRCGQ